ncbi:amidohydrolase [Pseudomonas sp. TTU2014-080ASC]|uniref:amidohydrolase n=1 Tax=Pseudomonas sp. TTU2014-080ASC TaxID=1729724 RepID=UPI0007185EBD|nr:amidohydrolase [Pseudomonas sp. TTU2014-080ASC]KRW59285.1 carbon-nitrogen hydrolase [Pseudomonas sp. TTU2014-080ASC]
MRDLKELSQLPDLEVALLQTELAWHDPQANREHFEALFAQAKGADLILLPEMFTTGFSMESAALAEPEDGPSVQWLQQQAQAVNAVIMGSLIIQAADGSYRNRLIWARPEGTYAQYDKRHLFRMAGEHKYYSAGDEQVVVELKGWKVRPLICYDLRFPVWSRSAGDTDLLIYTANWPAARRNHWNRLLPARAIENLCYVAAVNRVGTDGKGYPYSGDSQLLDFQGDYLIAPDTTDGVLRHTLSAKALADYRERFPAYLDADIFELR